MPTAKYQLYFAYILSFYLETGSSIPILLYMYVCTLLC